MKKITSVSKTLPHRRLKKRAAPTEAATPDLIDMVSDRPKPKKSVDERFFDPRKYQNWLV